MPASGAVETDDETFEAALGTVTDSAGLDARPVSRRWQLTAAAILAVALGAIALACGRKARKGSFLVVGDWGFDAHVHGDIFTSACQRKIADAMARKMAELGDVKFVVNVGDSFYPGGVFGKNDPQWEYKWRRIYSDHLRSVPWYSVYGNHDYHHDGCACGDGPWSCAQVNGNIKNLDFFYMPSYTWFRSHPELDLEVVALDLNHFVNGWNGRIPMEELVFDDCKYSRCPEKCKAVIKGRFYESLKLFYERLRLSKAKNLVVFSHYPTDYFSRLPDFIGNLSDASRHHIEYFGGHRHNVDQLTLSTWPNNNWLVGGGGGWGCEHYSPPSQGFVVGEIREPTWWDRRSVITYPVLIDASVCCSVWPTDTWKDIMRYLQLGLAGVALMAVFAFFVRYRANRAAVKDFPDACYPINTTPE